MGHWEFDTIKPSSVRMEVTQADQLNNDEVSLAEALVRESIQNSSDAFNGEGLVKVTGEFFAQTTEGDGNFHMFQFLEREGAEIKVEPIANWIMYLLWQAKARHRDRKWLDMEKPRP